MCVCVCILYHAPLISLVDDVVTNLNLFTRVSKLLQIAHFVFLLSIDVLIFEPINFYSNFIASYMTLGIIYTD